jgi:molybdopterin-containing oxidoreductase family iron-sulfur binding subunit
MSPLNHDTGMRYWRSLEELARTPEFREAVRREFPNDDWDQLPSATRRQFLRVMGASLGLAGLTACRWPKEEIVPFAHRPEDRVPGVPQRFATAMELSGSALGVVVTSYDGRPIKAEGNPEHPDSLGALSAVAQATILGLYDPDRSRRLVYREGGQEYVKTWDDFAAFVGERITGTGSGVAVLSEASSSPTLGRLRAELLDRHPEARWFEYEPDSRDNEREGLRLAFGKPLRCRPSFEGAEVIACFDADPLGEHPAALRLTREFATSRAPHSEKMSRLYVVESHHTLSGGRADHRLAVASSEVAGALVAVARQLTRRYGVELPAAIADMVGAADADSEFVEWLANDLATHGGRSVILVGHRQPPEVHALAAVVNRALDDDGRGVTYAEESDPGRPSHLAAISELASMMRTGDVETLLILGGNPVYNAPADLGFAELLEGVPITIHLGLYDDETSRRCRWHLPSAHHLEAWGDGRAWDGTWTLQQPLIEPLYGGRSAIEVLALAIGNQASSGHDLVRETATAALGLESQSQWRRWLHDGVVPDSAAGQISPDFDRRGMAQTAVGLEQLLGVERPSEDRLELVLVADAKVLDGRFANNGWLQELPDAVTKITWDNALLMSPATARGLDISDGDMVSVTAAGGSVELPVYLLPGHARNSCTAALGYGREAAGQVGTGVGVDLYRLRTSDAPYVISGVEIRRTGRQYRLATTQDHHTIDTLGFAERNLRVANLVREATVEAYLADPEIIHHMDHHPPLTQLWQEMSYEGEQWGMAIDLNSCVGCNACVVACQAENNIPLVGRQQVIHQREMQWIRIDRYFKTDPRIAPDEVDDATMMFQPVACVHCENAPCEQVCPVAATQHTEDGLNAMAYNRCIGTRYCSNNCPYKVRRFNFFNYHRQLSEIAKMQFNPEVTVRSRGVMEKCTYCVQRIQNVRIQARNERRPIADGEVVPACAQTCPSRAIHFGNLNDPASTVSKLRSDPRSYATLAELNIRPRTHYLARLGNPADGGEQPGSAGHEPHGKESA